MALRPVGIDFTINDRAQDQSKLSQYEAKLKRIETLAKSIGRLNINLGLNAASSKRISSDIANFEKMNTLITQLSRKGPLGLQFKASSLTQLKEIERTLANINRLSGQTGSVGGAPRAGVPGSNTPASGGFVGGSDGKLRALGVLSFAGAVGGRAGLAGASLGEFIGGAINPRYATRGLIAGAGIGVVGNLAYKAGSAAFGLEKKYLPEALSAASSYHKNLRVISNITGGKLQGNELQRFGNNILDLSVQQGAGAVQDYFDVFRSSLGKGLTETAAMQFTKQSGKLAIQSGSTVDKAAEALLPILLANSSAAEKSGILKKNSNGEITSFNDKLLERESNRLYALTAFGGLEIEDIRTKAGALSTSAISGNVTPLQAIGIAEAISTIAPNPENAVTYTSKFLTDFGDIKKQKKLLKALQNTNGLENEASGFESKLKSGKLNALDVLDVATSAALKTKNGNVADSVVLREIIGQITGNIRTKAGAYAIYQEPERIQKALKFANGNTDDFAQSFHGGFNFDLASQSLGNFKEVWLTRIGNTIAPFATQLIDTLVKGAGNANWNDLLVTVQDEIRRQFSDSPEVADALVSFAGKVKEYSEKIQQFVQRTDFVKLADSLVSTIFTVNDALFALAKFIREITATELTPRETAIANKIDTNKKELQGVQSDIQRARGYQERMNNADLSPEEKQKAKEDLSKIFSSRKVSSFAGLQAQELLFTRDNESLKSEGEALRKEFNEKGYFDRKEILNSADDPLAQKIFTDKGEAKFFDTYFPKTGSGSAAAAGGFDYRSLLHLDKVGNDTAMKELNQAGQTFKSTVADIAKALSGGKIEVIVKNDSGDEIGRQTKFWLDLIPSSTNQ